ncbi:hypothetical protein C4569_01525 [Candidatus Parcubacteria bacterium]|nr:MAG: hypothetical protein C4569_01525 [Candidatus Parcubacteria bacterium]
MNILQVFGKRRIQNKISIWSRDAKGMVTSIVGMLKNIKRKRIVTMADAATNLETLKNFANSMFVSLEEELGRNKREISEKK